MVPVFTQTPPMERFFSMIATFLRSLAAQMAPFCPAGPLPITTRSYCCSIDLPKMPAAKLYQSRVPGKERQDFVNRRLTIHIGSFALFTSSACAEFGSWAIFAHFTLCCLLLSYGIAEAKAMYSAFLIFIPS